VVSAYHDGGLELTRAHDLAEREALSCSPQAQPADARGQALEGDALARHVEPAVDLLEAGNYIEHYGRQRRGVG